MPPSPDSIQRFIRHAIEHGHSEEHIRDFLERKGYGHHLAASSASQGDAQPGVRPPRGFGSVPRWVIIASVVLFIAIASALVVVNIVDRQGDDRRDEPFGASDNDTAPKDPIIDSPTTVPDDPNDADPRNDTDPNDEELNLTDPEANTTQPPISYSGGGSSGGSGSSEDPDDPDPTPAPEPEPLLNISTMTYTIDSSAFTNPERGFYWPVTFNDNDYSWVEPYNVSLVRSTIRLDDYRDSTIPEGFLDNVTTTLEAVRSAGLKAILRVAYNHDGSGTDASIERVLEHIEQLEPYFEADSDVIAVFEAGYIGAWGEWHSSSSGLDSDENKSIILEALLNRTPSDRMIQLRYPPDIINAYPEPITADDAFNGSDHARVGHHNDCFLVNDHDGGTYSSGSYTETQLRTYIEAIGPYTWTGGETCAIEALVDQRSDCTTALEELERYGWDHINLQYYEPVIDRWRSDGCFDEIDTRLGYRYALNEANLTNITAQDTNLTFSIDITNSGFSTLNNKRPLILALISAEHNETFTLESDARSVLPIGGERLTLTWNVTLSDAVYPDTYDAYLWLPDESVALRDDPRYSIRLANTDVWNGTNGMNDLNLSIEITGTPPSLENGTGLLASYFNSTSAERALVRIDETVNFSWGESAPHANVSADYFSVVWNGSVKGAENDSYILSVRSDDGFRLYVNTTLVADSWQNYTGEPGNEPLINTSPIQLTPWSSVPILLEYYEASGNASIELLWRREGEDASAMTIIPSEHLYPATEPTFAPPSGAPGEEQEAVVIGAQAVPSGNVSDGTLFASTTGSGSACTEADPCSLSEALTQTGPGDHLFLRGGVYPVSSQVSLTVTATNETPIVIESYPGERAVIDGQHIAARLRISGSYYTLRNLNVTRMNATGIYIAGTHNTLEGINSYGNYLSGIQIFSPYPPPDYGAEGSYNTIRDCLAFNNSDAGFTGGNYANGGNADGISISSGTYNRIIRCEAYNNSDDGIDVWRSTETLVAYSIVAGSGIANGDGVGFKMGGSAPSENAILIHSISYDNQGAGVTENSGSNVTMMYVTSYDNPDRSFFAWTDDHLIANIAAGAGADDSLFGQGTETNNSWQIAGSVTFVSTDPDSGDFLRPTPNGGFEHIGAYAQSAYVGLEDIDTVRARIG